MSAAARTRHGNARSRRGSATGAQCDGCRSERSDGCWSGRRRIDQGISTVSTTWITPFDCITLAIVTVDLPPFASVRTSFLPTIWAVRVPPWTVVSLALPLPALSFLAMSALVIRPATT